jgi:hypothetical protein
MFVKEFVKSRWKRDERTRGNCSLFLCCTEVCAHAKEKKKKTEQHSSLLLHGAIPNWALVQLWLQPCRTSYHNNDTKL